MGAAPFFPIFLQDDTRMTFTPSSYDPYDFANRRHIGPTPGEMADMLAALGCDSLEQLIDQTIPADLRQTDALDWAPLSEGQVLAKLRAWGPGTRS